MHSSRMRAARLLTVYLLGECTHLQPRCMPPWMHPQMHIPGCTPWCNLDVGNPKDVPSGCTPIGVTYPWMHPLMQHLDAPPGCTLLDAAQMDASPPTPPMDRQTCVKTLPSWNFVCRQQKISTTVEFSAMPIITYLMWIIGEGNAFAHVCQVRGVIQRGCLPSGHLQTTQPQVSRNLLPPPPHTWLGHCCSRYASCWNAYLLYYYLTVGNFCHWSSVDNDIGCRFGVDDLFPHLWNPSSCINAHFHLRFICEEQFAI